MKCRHFFPRLLVLGLFLTLGVASSLAAAAGQAGFPLKEGDRVLFYGDSITEQNLYNAYTESYVLTRFPKLKVSFMHAGWGGDSVFGGGGGPIDLRLQRDVIANKPTVLTIMLGMNDGRYRPFDEEIFNNYSRGYKHIIETLQQSLPNTRITLIQPSPFDDVTRAPNFPGGYNSVLLRFSAFIAGLAGQTGLEVADFNGPLVAALTKASTMDAGLAQKLIPDRVHPDQSAQLVMAASLLKSWQAPALVSAVELDAKERKMLREENATVSALTVSGAISWTQLDGALPMPIDLSNPVIALADAAGGVTESLNQQTLKVVGLPEGNHLLLIDGAKVGQFTAAELGAGINLARLATPMVRQAAEVHQLTLQHNRLHFVRWRSVQLGLKDLTGAKLVKLRDELRNEMDSEEAAMVEQQRAAAQPRAHRFELKQL